MPLTLQFILQQKTEAIAYQSEFDCPVKIRIYFPRGKVPEKKALIDIIESESLTYKLEETFYKVRLNYRVISITEDPEIISGIEFNRQMASD
jgi:hypothetical protein